VGRIVVTEYISIDGVIEAPGGEEDYEHVGWVFEFERGEEGQKFKDDETLGSAALLLGRITYETFALAWPTFEGEVADKMNSMPKYVATTTLDELEWENSIPIKGDVASEVGKLKEEDGGPILVAGSRTLVHTLMEHDLVDEYRLMVFPVVLGSGKRLFPESPDKTTLELVDTKTFETGVQVNTYRPPGR
jgi:dihydrofolate reductase